MLKLGAALEVAKLNRMSTAELRVRFMEATGRKPATNNRSYLLSRLCLLVQQPGGKALEKGSESATPAPPTAMRDPRLPGIGTVLTKQYKGRDLKVVVGEKDFTFQGVSFRSLSAIARAVTGTPWNGFLFFNLIPAGEAS